MLRPPWVSFALASTSERAAFPYSRLLSVVRRKSPRRTLRPAAIEACATSAASSRLGTSANLGEELGLGDIKSRARGHRTPREGHRRRSGGFRDRISSLRRPGRGFLAAEPRYQRAKDGRRLGSKLPQIVPITTTPGGRLAPRTALFYGFESAARNDILLYAFAGVPLSLGPRYQLTNLSPPRK